MTQLLYASYLSKKGGSRLRDVRTYKIECESNQMKAIQSLKAANELPESDFTHVALSKLKSLSKPIIVKMHEAGSPFATTELNILKILMNTPIERNIVKYLCDFTCEDDKSRWEFNIKQHQKFCPPTLPQGTKTSLHFIALEYIPNGDIVDFFKSNPSPQQLSSLFVQCALTIIDLGKTYKIRHGDLYSGNILIKRTSKKLLVYSLNETPHSVETHGIIPVFIDFGRGSQGLHVRKREIMDDIMKLFYVYSNWLDDASLKTKVREFVSKEYAIKRSTGWESFVDKIKELFNAR